LTRSLDVDTVQYGLTRGTTPGFRLSLYPPDSALSAIIFGFADIAHAEVLELRNYVSLFVNGQRHQVAGADGFLSLAQFVRERLRLTGTKVVCAEGDCGSCTVLCGRVTENRFEYLPVDSCIQFLFQLDGAHVVTVEGLSCDGQPTPVQQAMVDCHGSQCGFCTPGFVVAMTALACEEPSETPIDWRRGLTGNLCRCTGYSPILEAGKVIERSPRPKLNELYPPQEMLETVTSLAESPFELVDRSGAVPRYAIGPLSLAEAVAALGRFPDATLIAGGTDLGVQFNKRRLDPTVLIDLNRIAELEGIDFQYDGGAHRLRIGARTTWTQLAATIMQKVPELHDIISIFGSPQIRHVGTIGGNLANASPIADSIPFFMVMEAELELLGPNGSRLVNINDFYKGYKTLALNLGELITQIRVELPGPKETLRLIKVSRRRDLDISTLTAAIRMRVDEGTIQQPKIALGGVGPTVIRAKETERFLTGRQLTEDTMRQAGKVASSEITPISDVRGSAAYRFQLTRNVFLKFFNERCAEGMAGAPLG
jgi:xanthine dehydrogenase small subunit